MPVRTHISGPSKVRAHSAVPANFTLKMDVSIPARVAAISPLVDAVMAVVRRQAGAKELEIETALREALANAIKHGCHGDPTKFVQCQVIFEEDRSVLLTVRDPGAGFNPKTVPDPTAEELLYENHGRGIYLIRRLMDEVRFRRRGAEIHMRSRY